MHLARTRLLHWPAVQVLSSMCSTNSSSKKRSAAMTGPGVSWPRAHSESACIWAEMSRMVSTSAMVPLPSVMRVRTSSMRCPPTRQGTHLPHDSAEAKVRKYLANSTMQVSSSTTIMPPEPMTAPAATSESKSTGVFSAEAGRQPPSGPPVWTALKVLPSGTPPPTSKMISPRVMPMGTSMRPVLLILPVRAKMAVPGDLGVPMLAEPLGARSG